MNEVESVKKYAELNERIAQMTAEKLNAVFGTPEERKFMRHVLQMGVNAAHDLKAIIEAGLTFELWEAFVLKNNSIEGPLAVFENNKGELATLIKEAMPVDLRPIYDRCVEAGSFDIVNMDHSIDVMETRLAQMEQLWAEQDAETNN